MQVAILSDTHVPSRAPNVPKPFRERVREADHAIHAGDFDSRGTLSDVREWATELTAVAGNMDPAVGLSTVTSVQLGGVEFVVTHGTGAKRGYEDRVANAVRQRGDEGAVGVAGHTHAVMDEVHEGVRLLNPGSATGAAPASRTTMMTAAVDGGEIDVAVHEL